MPGLFGSHILHHGYVNSGLSYRTYKCVHLFDLGCGERL